MLLSLESAEIIVVSAGDNVEDSEKSENVARNGVGNVEDIWRAAVGDVSGLSGSAVSFRRLTPGASAPGAVFGGIKDIPGSRLRFAPF